VSGVLRSTTPPITPAAWTTFLTGKQPGKHGIIDFERYDVHSNKLAFNSTRCLDHVRNLWSILGERGYKIGSVNVPMTFPAVPVNGFLVSGFETPGVNSHFVHPPEIKPELLERWPDPTLRAKWKRSAVRGDAVFADNLDYISRSFHQGADMTMWLAGRFGWDALMVVFKLTDNLQHKTWKYIDPRWREGDPRRCDAVKNCFAQADRALGILLDFARENDSTVLIVSDHGHGSLEGKIHVNRLLEQWGYLVLEGGAAQGSTRIRHVWDRLRGRTKRFAREGNIADDLAVDFTKSRACVMHAGMAGFLYVNLKGRQPCGIVDPNEYEQLRDELRARLLSEECSTSHPDGLTVPLFPEVHKPEELYGCAREEQPWMPDLILIPYGSLAVVRKIRGSRVVKWLADDRIEGTHRPDGIIAAVGPGVANGRKVNAHIADCAPTILTLLGQAVPDDMDGKVIEELFSAPPSVKFEAGKDTAEFHKSQPEAVYSEEQLQTLTDRLTDLGYLE
jgi:predicted AlkP superfamily phosphohydrolase/phosphomutase